MINNYFEVLNLDYLFVNQRNHSFINQFKKKKSWACNKFLIFKTTKNNLTLSDDTVKYIQNYHIFNKYFFMAISLRKSLSKTITN
jgi:hypothetical protein